MKAVENQKHSRCRLRKNCQQGLDGMNLEYVLNIEGAERLSLPTESIYNENGKTIAEISCAKGKLSVYVNAVHCIRPNNVKSLTIADTDKLKPIQSKVIGFTNEYLKKHLQEHYSEEYINGLTVKKMECNITLPCVNGASPSDVINLFERAFDKTVLHKQRKNRGGHDKISTSCYYTKHDTYCLKIYDKTIEQHDNGNPLVESGLFRIEIVFLDKSLKKMYGDKRTLNDMLTKEAIIILCKEYKKVFKRELIEKHVKPYLDWCAQKIYDSLCNCTDGNPISETIAKNKEHIPDMEVLRKGLKKWYQSQNADDRSARILYEYRKKNIGIPEGVLKTIKAFSESC